MSGSSSYTSSSDSSDSSDQDQDDWTSGIMEVGNKAQTLSTEFDSLVGTRNYLTASIKHQAQAKSLQLEEMKETLPTLIEACLDRPEVLKRLFELLEMCNRALEKYEQLLQNTPNAVAPSLNMSQNIPNNNNANSSTATSSSTTTSTTTTTTSTTTSATSTQQQPESSSDDDSYSDWPSDSDDEWECPICFDDYEKEETIRIPECKHRYCKEDIQELLTHAINEGKVLDLSCPDPSCKSEIPYEIVEKLVTPKVFDKYTQFSLMVSLRTEPNARYCPNPQCEGVLVGEKGQGKITCDLPKCGTSFCFDCGQNWDIHEGKSCAAVKAELTVDPKMEKWKKKHKRSYKDCPKCSTPIAKTSGCNHMTCSCKYEFCWLCMGDWKALGGYGHFDNGSCSMYSGKDKAKEVALIGAVVVSAPLWLPVYGLYKAFK